MPTLGYHVVFTAYGFWLPNDPRGSWSDFIRNVELLGFGDAAKTDTRISRAHDKHNVGLRHAAKKQLTRNPVKFSGKQALVVAQGFDAARAKGKYRIHACCILPEHVHLVIGRHSRNIGRIIGHIKARATQNLNRSEIWKREGRVWSKGYWNVFLYEKKEVINAIQYVDSNPMKEGKKRQKWSFVEPFI
jgi:REP element-mobilizing transposase RayT